MSVSKLGEAAGLVAGVAVTIALRSSHKWNEPILVDDKPVDQIPGANRIGNHTIRRRHKEVVGPKVSAHAERLEAGLLRELVSGFGIGATEAPGTAYRLEVKVEDRLHAIATR